MHNPNPVPGAEAREAREPGPEGRGSLPGAESTAAKAVPAGRADSPAEAQGRRTLSTAFVRMGPDGHMTVELLDGRALVLRDVVMRPGDFCGVQVLAGSAGTKYCGVYGDVAAARPGGAPAPEAPSPATLDPVEPNGRP